ncbi:hypothetical protein ACLB2K_020968 [Fragaria x ananassa]
MAGMEEMSWRLKESLVLTDREARGVRIRPSAVAAARRCRFVLVCKVITPRHIRKQSFIELFSRLWRGEEGVTITDMEDNRFAARFQSERDMWKIHKVPFKYLSAEVAEDIGSEVGQIIDGKQGREADRVGTFLRARVRLNFVQPLLRKSKIDFPGVGSRVVEFQYERLPEFCQECGMIGYPTRVCDDLLKTRGKREEDRPYRLALHAEHDIHGRRIGERMYRSRFGDGGGESDHSDSAGGSFNYIQSGDEDNRRQQTAARENGGRRSFQSLSDNSSTVSFPLQIEGPGQDTASSPVKKGSHSTRVDIVEVEEKRLEELDMVFYTRPAVNRDSDEVITIGNVSEISECTLTGMMFKSAFGDGSVEGFSGCFQAMEHVVDTTSGLSAAGRNRKDRRLTSVLAKRKLLLAGKTEEIAPMDVSGKRKLELNIFNDNEERSTKKVILENGVPEVVEAARLPHHEQ